MNIRKRNRILKVLRKTYHGDMSRADALRVFDRMDLSGPVEFADGEQCLGLWDDLEQDWYVLERTEVNA